VSAATATPETKALPAAGAAEAPIYYSPTSPEQGLLLESGGEVVNFRFGRLQTDDPKLQAALEKGVREGRYFKADLPPEQTLVCGKCGLPWRHRKSYELHYDTHSDTR
jgi:hypothetical protein